MEKRLLVAIFLSFLVLYGYQIFVLKPAQDAAAKNKAQTAKQAAATAAATGIGSTASGAGGSEAASVQSAPVAGQQTAAAQPVVGEQAERDIVVETANVRAVFTNKGARLKSWKLKTYLDQAKHPQELVPTYLPSDAIRPFDLKVDDRGVNERMRGALFRVSGVADDGGLDATRAKQTLTFEYRDSSGLVVRKEFAFEPKSFAVVVNASVEAGGRMFNPTVEWGPSIGDQELGAEASRYVQRPEAIIVRGDKVERIVAADLTKRGDPTSEGEFTAVGVDDQYFMIVAMPQQGRMMRAEYQHITLPAPTGKDPKLTTDMVAFGVRQAQSLANVKFFFGPKDFDVLESVDRRLVRVINFGMFDFLAVPLLRALKWIHGYVGNYGWSIILLTLFINLVMFPLRHKSMVSMRKMQEIQPQVKAIQDRYAKYKSTDPEKAKMNTEMMALYKEKGVNPASGCVPMLLTMPVLFAFYSLLSAAIEIRGEPFMLWITDLSARDPYYVTPVLMGASQLGQQLMTPTTGDPVQAKMMLMMPVVFTFMFLWMPSGLVVYWLFSNLLGIGQQLLTNRLVGPPPNVARPAAERRLKK